TQMLLYIENQLMISAQKGTEFTNDDAFALYDGTIQKLFSNIGEFKGYIQPYVQALQILQKARDAGIPANELIDAVSGLQDEIAALKADKDTKAADLARLESELATYNDTATTTAKKLETLQSELETAKKTKQKAEKSW